MVYLNVLCKLFIKYLNILIRVQPNNFDNFYPYKILNMAVYKSINS